MIIEPSFEIMDNIDGQEIIRKIEQFGRVCYKSEGNIADGSAEKFIQNIIKNGLDHGQNQIKIILADTQECIMLKISNQVLHPEEIDASQVFDRFYKADAARNRTSTGLGLSIAKELVLRMEGEIWARVEGDEFMVEIQFPKWN